ncbi:response regulator [Candidatus Saccharibacteria bacterium]|nr:response regulator [Candidatus Saccharibacteria bacterium]
MSLHIAVIEDDLPIAQMYRFKLEADGFKVSVAHDGKQGLLLAEDIKPDLILLDLMMPVMTGSEMLEKLRQTKGGSKIRVIVLTNVSKNEAPHNLRFLNVDRYIVKAHYTPQQVIDVVREVLNIPQK